MLPSSPERYKGPHAVPKMETRRSFLRRFGPAIPRGETGVTRGGPQAIRVRQDQEDQEQLGLTRRNLLRVLAGTAGTLGAAALFLKTWGLRQAPSAHAETSENVERSTLILEGEIIVPPIVKIRTSPHVVSGENNLFAPHEYLGKTIVLINPEIIVGGSATPGEEEETWARVVMRGGNLFDYFLGRENDAYVNLGEQTRDFVEVYGKLLLTEVDYIKRGDEKFFRKEGGEEIRTSIRIQGPKSDPKAQRANIDTRVLFNEVKHLQSLITVA